ncbi:hypothetical protein Ae201684_012274 [Aphanomyces euteiches]|uniref:Uncharacterized protein n=1 Tax=Aphanomyces euteiches TaxID=100861 RepID=A0A6G0WS41_9STRA|nr:hypothetical protein Ae201684_012274 [Aphanomyces euteiches]
MIHTQVVQQTWPGTLQSWKDFFQNHLENLLFRDPTHVSIESAESTKLYRKVTEDGSLFNILNGNFVEADRFVVVFRQIEHDEAFSCEPYRQRHNMTWMDIRPLSETQVVFRAIVQYSQFFREDLGFVSLDEQAEVWNVDLTGVPVEKKLEVQLFKINDLFITPAKLSDDEKLRRRLYFRDKQREHRNRLRHDIVAAKAEFEDLTALATPLKAKHRPLVDADGILSWCVVAGVFREELYSSTSEHQSLLKETRARETLLKAMQRFVSLNLHLEPEGPVRHWHPATLLEHPQARKLGKEWLTQQLYHNKDTNLARNHRLVPENHTETLIFKDPTQISIETTENTKLYRKISADGSFFNILQGNFVEADRFVMVFRQVENDETFNSDSYRQRHSMAWMDVRPLSETHVVYRSIYTAYSTIVKVKAL